MSSTNVYIMEHVMDDGRRDGFSFWDLPSLRGREDRIDDFMPDTYLGWKIPRLAGIWKPTKVQGFAGPDNDYPGVDGLPAFSGQVVAALRDILEANGELLPIDSDSGRFWAYNVTTVADVLNHDKSEIIWFDETPRVLDITRYEFIPERLEGLTIFRIPEMPDLTYVTDTFVNRVTEASLRRFDFAKIWPLPEGVSWRKLHKQETAKRSRRSRRQK